MEIKKYTVVGNYKIVQNEDNTIEVFNGGVKVTTSTIDALRNISDKISFLYSDKWNTQTFGSKLIDHVNTLTSVVATTTPLKMEVYTPTIDEMHKYHKIWEGMTSYVENEKVLNILFQENPSFKLNKDIQSVMTKCATLNTFYSTHIPGQKIYEIAKDIVSIKDVDERLSLGDKTLVDEIAKAGDDKYKYSFATKYCSHHQPDKFPIYDDIVATVLYILSKQHPASLPRYKKDLKDYEKFVEAIDNVREYFHLSGATYKDIDRYLWVYGRENNIK